MNKVLIVLLLAFIFIGCSDPEPAAKGKSLSEWIQQLSSEDEEKILEAIEALGEIGPDAYPARMVLIALMSKYAAKTDQYFAGEIMIAITETLKEIDKPFPDEKKSNLSKD